MDTAASEDHDDDNWLNAAPVDCPGCGEALYRVDHSPFMDCTFLYCGDCPRRVDVSWYDPVYRQVREHASGSFADMMAAIEARLAPCECGGAFRHDAWRRCFTCSAPLRSVEPLGVDLWPAPFWLEESGDPDAVEAAFTERWIRGADIWRTST
ncbi:hypothetical protein F4561_000138 [Lipingzhangella halophila]|uniref:Uncharacterized protein n=1 Tax=Lipingzhangella halophila TaxID=1783352 RepID=A0A7W7RCY1_9ACTN|nr:hypothetical protein [Lipingzhangella halophila]MBB4929318.1 hypothetical protein [Lipingzhangella halophila]